MCPSLVQMDKEVNNLNLIQIYYHQTFQHFPNPNDYNPENFTVQASAKRHPFAYVPFSAGPRKLRFFVSNRKNC